MSSKSSGGGTTHGYTIEVRSPLYPKTIGEQIVTEKWSTLHLGRSPLGVRNPILSRIAGEQGLLTYATAIALIAWTDADAGGFATGLEFRLVKKVCKYEWTVEVEGYGGPLSMDTAERAATFAPTELSPTVSQ